MHVRIDHVADRQFRVRPHGREQCLADVPRAAGVDHRDAAAADDEADIGDIAAVVPRQVLDAALVHEDAGGDLVNRKGRCRAPDPGRDRGQHQPGSKAG